MFKLWAPHLLFFFLKGVGVNKYINPEMVVQIKGDAA